MIDVENEDEVTILLEPVPSSSTDQEFNTAFYDADFEEASLIFNGEFDKVGKNRRRRISSQQIEVMHNEDDEDYKSLNCTKLLKTYLIFYGTKYTNFIVPPRISRRKNEIKEIECTCNPPKLGMLTISVIQLIFFFINNSLIEDTTKESQAPLAAIFIYDPAKKYQIWRFFTYTFIHLSETHLCTNVIIQILFGISLEMYHGWWRVILIYSAGVIGGSLLTSIIDPTIKLAGASGGVYSMITAHVTDVILNWSSMTWPSLQLLALLAITGNDLGTSVYNRYLEKNDQTGYAAHLAGASVGLLVGNSILKNYKVTKMEKIVWWCVMICYFVLMMVGVIWNIVNG